MSKQKTIESEKNRIKKLVRGYKRHHYFMCAKNTSEGKLVCDCGVDILNNSLKDIIEKI